MNPPPIRLQLSRRKGFDLQTHSRAINGLPAVNVARPSRWGNHYIVGHDGNAQQCVDLFREFYDEPYGRSQIAALGGYNLACWCAPGCPCHADVLIELANASVCS